VISRQVLEAIYQLRNFLCRKIDLVQFVDDENRRQSGAPNPLDDERQVALERLNAEVPDEGVIEVLLVFARPTPGPKPARSGDGPDPSRGADRARGAVTEEPADRQSDRAIEGAGEIDSEFGLERLFSSLRVLDRALVLDRARANLERLRRGGQSLNLPHSLIEQPCLLGELADA